MGLRHSKEAVTSPNAKPESILEEGYVLWKFVKQTPQETQYLSLRNNDNKIYLIKSRNKGAFDNAEGINRVKNELRAMKTLRSGSWDYGPRLCGAFQSPTQLYMITEYDYVSDLRSFLTKKKHPISDAGYLYFIASLQQGIEYLHDKDIMHRDLRPETLLLTGDGRVKIGGFDFAIGGMQENTECFEYQGSEEYMSPERIKKDAYRKCADLWSFAIIIVELLGHKNPFLKETPEKTKIAITERKSVAPKGMRHGPRMFINYILEYYKLLHYAADQIGHHEFFHPTLDAVLRNRCTEPFWINVTEYKGLERIDKEEPYPSYVSNLEFDLFEDYYAESVFKKT